MLTGKTRIQLKLADRIGLRDRAGSVDERLWRMTRRPSGDRLEAYPTLRRRLVAVDSWRDRQDALLI